MAKAPLVVVAPSRTIVYGESPGGEPPMYEGLTNGDTTVSLDTPPTCTPVLPDGLSSFVVGSYQVTCTGAADTNYEISYRSGLLTVTKAAVIVTARPVGTRWPLVIGRLTFSATVTNASTGAPVFDLPVTFTTRPLIRNAVRWQGRQRHPRRRDLPDRFRVVLDPVHVCRSYRGHGQLRGREWNRGDQVRGTRRPVGRRE